MQAVEDKIINRVYGNGRGWAFSKNDFIGLGSAVAIGQALSRLVKKQRIRRVMRGLYDYPKFSGLLGKELSADMDQIAQALARKFAWRIQVSGNTALNVLGLSTQVPGKYVYMSDAKSCEYQIGQQTLYFKKGRLKDMGLKYPQSALLVQAIKALDKRQLNNEEKEKIRKHFDPMTCKRILKDTQFTTSWVYEQIKGIMSSDER